MVPIHKSRFRINDTDPESCRLCNIAHNESYKAQIIAEMVNPAQTSESREAIKDDSPSRLHFKLYEGKQGAHTCTVGM